MRGLLVSNDSHMHMEHPSIRSLISFDIPGHQTDILHVSGIFGYRDGPYGIFL